MPRESTTGSAIALAPRRPVRFEHRPFSDVVVTGYPGTYGGGRPRRDDRPVGLPAGPRSPRPARGCRSRSRSTCAPASSRSAWVPGTALADPATPAGPVSRSVEVGTLLADLHGSGVVVDRVRDRPTLARIGAPSGCRRRGRPHHLGPGARRVRRGVARRRPGLAARRGAPAPRAQPRQPLAPHRPGQPPRAGAPRLRPPPDGRARARPRARGPPGCGSIAGARDLPDTAALLGDLVSGYAATARRVPADRAALEVHLAVALVGIAHGLPSLRRDHFGRIRVLRGRRPRWPSGTPTRAGGLARCSRPGAALSPRAAPGGRARPRGRGSARARGRLALTVSPDERPCSRRCTHGPAYVRAHAA